MQRQAAIGPTNIPSTNLIPMNLIKGDTISSQQTLNEGGAKSSVFSEAESRTTQVRSKCQLQQDQDSKIEFEPHLQDSKGTAGKSGHSLADTSALLASCTEQNASQQQVSHIVGTAGTEPESQDRPQHTQSL